VVGVIAVPLALGWLYWEKVALPRQRSIRSKLRLRITELIVDPRRPEVLVRLLVENVNKFSSLNLLEFRGGVVRLDSNEVSKSLQFVATASDYHLDAPGEAKATIWFTLHERYLAHLQCQKANCEQVYWELDSNWRLVSLWGGHYLESYRGSLGGSATRRSVTIID
jgi:hypothetical protein